MISGYLFFRTNPSARLLAWFDRWYVAPMLAMAAIAMWLQYHNDFGHLAVYEDYCRIARAGFDPRAARCGFSTCPMWGYAALVAVTTNKFLLLLFQNALGVFSTWFFLRSLETAGALRPVGVRALKLLAVCSLPWYAYLSSIGERPVAVGLLLLSCALLFPCPGRARPDVARLALSSALFGLALNFRSDFVLLPPVLAALTLPAWRPARQALPRLALWLAGIYMLLIPWAVYTRSATGHALLTSTNSGHVLFCGLGGRPGNKWNITQHDMDPKLLGLVREELGPGTESCSYEGSALLKRRWNDYVREDPVEYFRNCAYSLGHMIVGGVYSGNFDRNLFRKLKPMLNRRALRDIVAEDPFFWTEHLGFRVAAQVLSELTGRVVVFLAFLFFPFALWRAARSRALVALTSCGCVAYQWAINMFVSNVRGYMSSMYLFYLIIIVYGLAVILRHGRGEDNEEKKRRT